MTVLIEHRSTDVLVLGGGLSGYRAAVAARDTGASVTMAYQAHGASPYVIGFNAPLGAVDERDGPDVFFDDMVRGGYGLNDRRLVRLLATGAVQAHAELAALGVPFALQSDGRPAQRHLSGNTYARSVYVPDGTGGALMRALQARARALGVDKVNGCKVVDLLRDDATVVGALLWKPQTATLLAIHARATVMALGGIGRLYADSTYPTDVSADALGLALEAGARLIDMEFVQFEPVVTVWPVECRGMEMPTAMLGDGAQLRNVLGERFMLRTHGPSAERGIEKARMALHIQREIDEGRGFPEGGVVFDTTLLPPAQLESYVSHCARLRRAGVDPAHRPPLVAPAAHSVMGGIAIDETGACGVPGLFVGGEAAGGVHGASRVAGNGCADTLVFGALAGRSAAGNLLAGTAHRRHHAVLQAASRLRAGGQAPPPDLAACRDSIRRTLSGRVGIWRSDGPLREGLAHLETMSRQLACACTAGLAADIALAETRRMVMVARAIASSALARTESRGAHQRLDHPASDDARWLRHIALSCPARDELALQTLPIH